MSEITKPIILDETGRAIVAAITQTDIVQQRIAEINAAAEETLQSVIASIPPNYTAFIEAAEKFFVTPEMFGAIGDGVADDTAAVEEALSKGVVIGNGSYCISSELHCKYGIIRGNFKFVADSIRIYMDTGSYAYGVTIDCNGYGYNAFTILNASGVLIEQCVIQNIGQTSNCVHCGGIFVKNSSSNCIRNNTISTVACKISATCYGINVEGDSFNNIIEHNTISSIGASNLDADGVKLMTMQTGNNIVRANHFIDCYHRCIKFKEDNSHSEYNIFEYIDTADVGLYVVDFQRSFCSSRFDTIILKGNKSVYDVYCCCGHDNLIENVKIDSASATITSRTAGGLVRIIKSGDAGTTTEAGITLKDLQLTMVTDYLISSSESALETFNINIENVNINRATSSFSVCNISNSISKLKELVVKNLHVNDSVVFLSGVPTHDDFRCVYIDCNSPLNSRFFSYPNCITRVTPQNYTNVILMEQRNDRVEYIVNDIYGFSGATGGKYDLCKGAPVGTIFRKINENITSDQSGVHLGWIITDVEDSSKVGTMKEYII